ncbi:hypothetical protein JCM19239_1588 [Vibrio variabilis]|uniref:Uncharacterized protein n=1 Tax=Vibrio variabilis TaxID=990271 RepID=A0ABQ0JIB6_9VIBR|nr:hypothetical protein JCM19239_1588 [Vibrio variabilis]
MEAVSSENSHSQDDIQRMFEAAQEIAASLMNTSGKPTYDNLLMSIQFMNILKQTEATPLYNLAQTVIHKYVLDPIDEEFEVAPVQVDDAYPKYDIYNKDGSVKLTIDFTEVDESSLTLRLSGNGESAQASVRFIDSSKERFEIDKDLGASFLASCKVAIQKHLS